MSPTLSAAVPAFTAHPNESSSLSSSSSSPSSSSLSTMPTSSSSIYSSRGKVRNSRGCKYMIYKMGWDGMNWRVISQVSLLKESQYIYGYSIIIKQTIYTHYRVYSIGMLYYTICMILSDLIWENTTYIHTNMLITIILYYIILYCLYTSHNTQ